MISDFCDNLFDVNNKSKLRICSFDSSDFDLSVGLTMTLFFFVTFFGFIFENNDFFSFAVLHYFCNYSHIIERLTKFFFMNQNFVRDNFISWLLIFLVINSDNLVNLVNNELT